MKSWSGKKSEFRKDQVDFDFFSMEFNRLTEFQEICGLLIFLLFYSSFNHFCIRMKIKNDTNATIYLGYVVCCMLYVYNEKLIKNEYNPSYIKKQMLLHVVVFSIVWCDYNKSYGSLILFVISLRFYCYLGIIFFRIQWVVIILVENSVFFFSNDGKSFRTSY